MLGVARSPKLVKRNARPARRRGAERGAERVGGVAVVVRGHRVGVGGAGPQAADAGMVGPDRLAADSVGVGAGLGRDTRCPIRTRGRLAWPGEAQETTTPVAGFSLQVRWTCSGVPSLAARDRRARVAAFAGLTVAAEQAGAAGAGQHLAA